MLRTLTLAAALPPGVRTGTEVRLGSLSKMDRFLDTLDHYLQVRLSAQQPWLRTKLAGQGRTSCMLGVARVCVGDKSCSEPPYVAWLHDIACVIVCVCGWGPCQ